MYLASIAFINKAKNSIGRTFHFVCEAFSESALLTQVTLMQNTFERPFQKSQDISKYLSSTSSISPSSKATNKEQRFSPFTSMSSLFKHFKRRTNWQKFEEKGRQFLAWYIFKI